MGMLNLFKNIGIKAEETASYFGTRSGKIPLQWPAGEVIGLIWRLPRNPEARASLFAERQSLVVNEGEIAVVLEDGRSAGVLKPGAYTFDKKISGSLDIIWIRTGRQLIRWGIGNVTTQDGISMGANGSVALSVVDGECFNREIIQASLEVTLADLQKSVLPGIQGVMRSELALFKAIQLKHQRELFRAAIEKALAENLMSMGLILVEFEIAEFSFPAEFDMAISRKTLITYTAEADLLEAQSQAQMTAIAAQAEAKAQFVTGMTQVQLMANMQSLGIDPLKNKALDALHILAAHPGQGIAIGNDRSMLFTHVVDGVLGASNMTEGQQTRIATAGSSDNAATISAKIDQLTERLVNGELNGDTYDRAVKALNDRLTRQAAP